MREASGRLSATQIEAIAVLALATAKRSALEDPLVVALELGFAMLPRGPGVGVDVEIELTTKSRLVFAAVAALDDHASRVRLALARGLLLRTELPHDPADVHALARRLGQGSASEA